MAAGLIMPFIMFIEVCGFIMALPIAGIIAGFIMAPLHCTKAVGSLNAEAFWAGLVIFATQPSAEVGVAAGGLASASAGVRAIREMRCFIRRSVSESL
ncbi:MAG: hypothetical protein B7Y26_01905 [Hydrogenophilales bacterium 16-64-46]|nr:MAG: hypothetical protein B7Z32_01605 [Hydrogenophilales bacterium 12-64-13]OYZ06585.1 MAG: hypothetical protein B7Y26_01905 [Hydrogenophilales bacterium 16-64-46]OZA39293.1 MAG: hypothetical protein B7X87_03010 [Hydrogenophilales bacterium 17-64-34]